MDLNEQHIDDIPLEWGEADWGVGMEVPTPQSGEKQMEVREELREMERRKEEYRNLIFFQKMEGKK